MSLKQKNMFLCSYVFKTCPYVFKTCPYVLMSSKHVLMSNIRIWSFELWCISSVFMFYFYFLTSKVNQKSIINASCHKIINELNRVNCLKTLYRLKLKYKTVLHDNVSFKVTNNKTFIIHLY